MGNPDARGHVLVVEDDAPLRAWTATLLQDAGYSVVEAGSGSAALVEARLERPQAVVLDVRLPDLSGYEVCHTLRADDPDLPIVFISGERVESYDRVAGLLIGADDYLVKPFGKAELLARINAVMRRADAALPRRDGPGAGAGRELRAGDLVLEPGRHAAYVRDAALTLTPTEFRLLEALVRAGGELVPHLRLARAGWPAEPDPDLLWLKPHLARLRGKLEAVGGPAIVAVRSVGYRIDEAA
jgi:DNA-binding response OmpR family regulator